eukprot:gene2277-1662_t
MTSIKNVQIRGDTEYQEIVGFGGAFTEATAYHFFKLPPLLQRKFLDLYFGENGIKFSLGRIHINSCDFSLGSYNFDEVPDDYTLKYFDDNVTHDTLEIIPLLREAMAASELNIRLVASPWSPPAWMKTPSPSTGKSSMLGSVTPNGLRNEARVKYAWAKYISRFVSAYKAKGVDIWAVTPQNEPEFPAPWEACSYNASFESDFINHFLGPILRHEHPHLKLLAFDHNKDHLEAWTKEILGKDKHNYVDGMAFHWYGGEDRMTDGTYGYEAVKATTTSANTATATATTTPPTAQTVHPAYQNRGNLLSLLTYQHQVFQYDESTHEITLPAAAVIASLRDSTTTTTTNSDHANGPATATPVESTESSPMQQMCLTAGWPFFNAVAFAVPADFQDAVDRTKFAHHKSTSGASSSAANPAASTTSPEPESTRNGTATSMRTVIVAMNEATVDLPITLHDQKRRADFVYSMSPRSIQTIVYKN